MRKQESLVKRAHFSSWLKLHRDRAGWTQKELAERLPVETDAVSKYEQNKRRPEPPNAVALLNLLRATWGVNGSVAEALDGILPLDYTWEDIRQAAEARYMSAERQAFLDWWEDGRPTHPLYLPNVALPRIYVERALLSQIRAHLIQWAAVQQVRYQGILLYGPSGSGKTTLAQSLVLDADVQQFFRDGILWINAQDKREQPRDWPQKLCNALGLEKHSKYWSQVWQAWASARTRRCLVVLDEVTPEQDLKSLITGLGPQMVILATTQSPEVIKRKMGQDLTMWQHEIPELELPEVQDLVAQVIEQQVKPREIQILKQVRRKFGWTPDTVLLAAQEANRENGWVHLKGFIQEGNLKEGGLARHHVEQIRTAHPSRYRWLQVLIKVMEYPWPFGVEYGMAVWNIPKEQATYRLGKLTQAGLLTELQGNASVFVDADVFWRVKPWIYTSAPEVPRLDHWWQELRVRFIESQVARRLARQSQTYVAAPWWLPLLGLPLMAVMWPLEVSFLIYYKAYRAKRQWSLQTWQEFAPIFLLAAMRVQEMDWETQRGLSQEYWLLLAFPMRTIVWMLSLTLISVPAFFGFAGALWWNISLIDPPLIALGYEISLNLSMLTILLGLILFSWEYLWLAWVASQTEVNALIPRLLRWIRSAKTQ